SGINEQENQRDLYRIQNESDVRVLGLLVAIEQDGHGKKSLLHVEHEPDERQLRRLRPERNFAIGPADVRQAPGAKADPDQNPKGLPKLGRPPRSVKARVGGDEAGDDLQQVSE